MTALSLVAVDGVIVEPEAPAGQLDRAGAEALTLRGIVFREQALDGLRGLLGVLAEGHGAEVHLALGFDSFHAWAEYVVGDLAALRLTSVPEAIGVRQALVRSLRADGAAQAAIVRRLGVSAGTVRNDLRDDDPAPERIVGADGRSRQARTAVAPSAPLPAPAGRVWQQAAEWLRRHPAGLTLVELARVAGWTEGKASGALSDVRRRGMAVRVDDRRLGQRVHLHAVAGEVTA